MSVPEADPNAALDPFDPERLRLSENMGQAFGVKRAITIVPVRKPSREAWIHVHPDPQYRLPTGILELKEDREAYIVLPELWPALSADSVFGPRLLVTYMTRQNVLALWPLRLPAPDGRFDNWGRSALEAVDRAEKGWVRLVPNLYLGAYEVFEASGDLPEPQWPDLPFREILRIAFKDHTIASVDHPVLRRLRGEA
jgi:hypothetical protein